jgi:hypothetical protein
MFYRYARNVAKADMGVSDELSSFTDRGGVSAWAGESMSWAVGAGLINGTTATALSRRAPPQGPGRNHGAKAGEFHVMNF